MLLALASILCPGAGKAQYILNGAATQNSCNCYTLTPAQNFLSGSVWNMNKINLNNPFDFVFNVYLGCKDADGADGIVFILQPISTSIGTSGGGLGFQGITPSIGISLDTWQNVDVNDPPFDHLSIQLNGNTVHNSDITPVVQALPTNPNIEDCQWHTFRIVWNPLTKQLQTYFGGYFAQQVTIDLVATVFNNDPMVYWGFSAATGGSNNLQQFCTALNPNFNAIAAVNPSCENNTLTFTNTSQSFSPVADFFWDFGDNTTSTLPNPPPHSYPAPGAYEVKLAITALDGCRSDTMKKTFIVGDRPVAKFEIVDTCEGKPPRITESSTSQFGNITEWQWTIDGTNIPSIKTPTLAGLSRGPHQLTLVAKSEHGCLSLPVTKEFIMNLAPHIDMDVEAGCAGVPLSFTALQLDNASFIKSWEWDLDDGASSNLQNPVHTYLSSGPRTVSVIAIENNGCESERITKTININSIIANAGKDTVVLSNVPFTFHSSYISSDPGPAQFSWSPSTGMDNPQLMSPVTTLQDDEEFVFRVVSTDGCVDTDRVRVTVFKSSAIYVPTAFTPNNDGRNDILRPMYAGIKSLDYFRIFNRWGQPVLSTNSFSGGWDGRIAGKEQSAGSYVWMLKATDYAGKVYEMKGQFVLIR